MRKRTALGPAIRAIRTAAGVSQSALAPRVGVTQGWLSQIESGDRFPAWDLTKKIAKELGVPVEAISYPEPVDCPTCEQVAA